MANLVGNFQPNSRELQTQKHGSRHGSFESPSSIDLKKEKRLQLIFRSLRSTLPFTRVVQLAKNIVSKSTFFKSNKMCWPCKNQMIFKIATEPTNRSLDRRDRKISWRRFSFFKSMKLGLSNELCVDPCFLVWSAREFAWNFPTRTATVKNE